MNSDKTAMTPDAKCPTPRTDAKAYRTGAWPGDPVVVPADFARELEREIASLLSKEEAKAASGIMALLPDDIVDWDYGPFPDRTQAEAIESDAAYWKKRAEEALRLKRGGESGIGNNGPAA